MEKPQNLLSRLRRHPLLWNLLLIAAIILAMAVVAHLVMQFGTRHGAAARCPDLSGVALDERSASPGANDLVLQVNDSLFVPAYAGGVVSTSCPKGVVEVKPGRTVYLTINAFRQKKVPVPYVAGRSLRQAKNMLEIAGLEIAELVYRPDLATNYVLEEYYDGRPYLASSRLEAEIGSGVTLHVGVQAGDSITIVPQVVGLPLQQAKGRLWELGLNIGRIDFDEGINLLNQKEARLPPDAGCRACRRAGFARGTAPDARCRKVEPFAGRGAQAGRRGRRRAHPPERERDSLARIEGAARPELPAAVAPATTAPEEKRRRPPPRAAGGG